MGFIIFIRNSYLLFTSSFFSPIHSLQSQLLSPQVFFTAYIQFEFTSSIVIAECKLLCIQLAINVVCTVVDRIVVAFQDNRDSHPPTDIIIPMLLECVKKTGSERSQSCVGFVLTRLGQMHTLDCQFKLALLFFLVLMGDVIHSDVVFQSQQFVLF